MKRSIESINVEHLNIQLLKKGKVEIMKIRISSAEKLWGYILIYFLLLMNGATFYRINQYNYVTIILWVSIVIILKKKAYVPRTVWKYVF